MATFVAKGNLESFGPGGTAVNVDTPPGTSNGDTLFFAMMIDNAQTGTVNPTLTAAITQVGSWVTGVADGFNAPALGLFRITQASSIPIYDWSFTAGASRGGSVLVYAYSGDCTHRQTVTGTSASNSSPRNSPTVNGTSGNLVIGFMGGSAASTTLAWSGGFTERDDQEYYGLNSAGDAASGASVTATVTPTGDPTQSIWIMEEVGANAPGVQNQLAWITA